MEKKVERISFNVDAYTARLIGRENVSKLEGALLELVKNAYDADAKHFCMYYSDTDDCLYVVDDGQGMTQEIIRDHWMTIGNSSKKNSFVSSGKRIQTGAKGIGRFALDRIADQCSMLSICNGVGIQWDVDWRSFEGEKKLTDVQATIQGSDSTLRAFIGMESWSNVEAVSEIPSEAFSENGTAFILTGLHDTWDKKQIDQIRNSLENMLPYSTEELGFEVFFFDEKTSGDSSRIESSNVDNYDYKITFSVKRCGDDSELSVQLFRNEYELRVEEEQHICSLGFLKEDLEYFNGKPKDQRISFSEISEKNVIGDYNGTLFFNKVRLSNRDRERFHNKDITGRPNYVKYFGGIKIYRDFFRVRPYGEYEGGDFDWLKLAERSAASPAGPGTSGAWRVNANQIMGIVNISRLNSGLEDAANRNGIQDGEGFEQLKRVLIRVISLFEQDRQYVSRVFASHDDREEKLSEKRERIRSAASAAGVFTSEQTELTITDVNEFVDEFEQHYQDIIEDLQDEKKMLQTLATTGIITNLFVHEIRALTNSLGYEMDSAYDSLVYEKNNDAALQSIKNAISLKKNFAMWFSITLGSIRKDKRRRKVQNLNSCLTPFISVWKSILLKEKVTLNYRCDEDLEFRCFLFDIENIISNLITNSLASFDRETGKVLKETIINLNIYGKEEGVIIEYDDSGWGLIPRYKENPDMIMEAFESSRGINGEDSGSGMGMWIVKSTITEYNGSINLSGNRNREEGFEVSLSLGGKYV